VLLNGKTIRSKLVWETLDYTGHFKLAWLNLTAAKATDAQLCFKLWGPCNSLETLCTRKDGSCK
jgi:hypothetical protein